jgi:hypothetical protein
VTSADGLRIEEPLRLVPLRGTQPHSGGKTNCGHGFILFALCRPDGAGILFFGGFSITMPRLTALEMAGGETKRTLTGSGKRETMQQSTNRKNLCALGQAILWAGLH